MKQTPITKAIEQLNSKITISKQDMEYYRQTAQMNSVKTEHDIQNGLLHAIQILTDLLPYEREVIEQTFQDADDDRVAYENGNGIKYLNPNHYFTKTFIDLNK